MKILFMFCLCLLLVQTSFSQSEEFFKKVLAEKVSARNGYFVALDVKSNVYNGRVIVTNGGLYYFVSKTKKFNKTQYNQFMMKLLSNKDIFPLKKAALVRNRYFLRIKGFNSIEFMPVRKVESVEESALEGCKAFIEHYFDKNLILKGNKGDEERNAIVDKLFEWKIPTFIEDYGGMLAIESNDFKCP